MGSSRLLMKITYIFATAIAVAIISLGSLINFHQYKIWGKPLIPQFVGIKRDVQKSDKYYLSTKMEKGNTPGQKFSCPDFLLGTAPLSCDLLTGSLVLKFEGFQSNTPRLEAGTHALRAPPLS